MVTVCHTGQCATLCMMLASEDVGAGGGAEGFFWREHGPLIESRSDDIMC